MLFKILTREGKSDSRDTETNELSPTITSFYCLGERFHDTALQNKAQAETDRLPELRKYIWNVQRHNIQWVLRRSTDVPPEAFN